MLKPQEYISNPMKEWAGKFIIFLCYLQFVQPSCLIGILSPSDDCFDVYLRAGWIVWENSEMRYIMINEGSGDLYWGERWRGYRSSGRRQRRRRGGMQTTGSCVQATAHSLAWRRSICVIKLAKEKLFVQFQRVL